MLGSPFTSIVLLLLLLLVAPLEEKGPLLLYEDEPLALLVDEIVVFETERLEVKLVEEEEDGYESDVLLPMR